MCQCSDLQNRLAYTTLCDEPKLKDEKVKIDLRNISCDSKHYCNREIIALDGDEYNKFMCDFNENKVATKKYFSDKEPQEPTYRESGDGTEVTLQAISELQLQLSIDDETKKNGLGLRLLRIGENCHYCFLHMNHPELAFMSDRNDIRDMELERKIDALTEMSIDEKLESTQFTKVDDIIWHDEYLSGGTVQICCEIYPGDFLCIRKEIKNENDDIKYLWNAHALISSSCTGSEQQI